VKAVLLPGLDGSGRLFAPFLAAGPRAFDPDPISYPADRALGYGELAALVRPRLPRGRFLLLAESFSGPLAVTLAAERPRGLVALVLAATFLRRPLGPVLHPVRGLVSARLFGLPVPAPLVRHLMAGADAPDTLVEEVRRAVAAVAPEVLALRSAEALAADVRGALGAVEVPILFLAPTRDNLIRRDAHEDVREARPDAEIALLDAPHMVLQRSPHASLERIEEFLALPPDFQRPAKRGWGGGPSPRRTRGGRSYRRASGGSPPRSRRRSRPR
jgi:pimeloyl-ACP methyl ester carboxylesterase